MNGGVQIRSRRQENFPKINKRSPCIWNRYDINNFGIIIFQKEVEQIGVLTILVKMCRASISTVSKNIQILGEYCKTSAKGKNRYAPRWSSIEHELYTKATFQDSDRFMFSQREISIYFEVSWIFYFCYFFFD